MASIETAEGLLPVPREHAGREPDPPVGGGGVKALGCDFEGGMQRTRSKIKGELRQKEKG